MKSFFKKYTPVILYVGSFLLTLAVKKVDEKKTYIENLTSPDNYIYLLIALILTITFIFYQKFTFSKQNNILKNYKAVRNKTLDFFCKDIDQVYKDAGIEIRINFMIVEFKIFKIVSCSSSYKEKYRFFKKFLVVDYEYKHKLRNAGDVRLDLTSDQGVAGKSYTNKILTNANFNIQQPSEFNLNTAQIAKTANLKVIFSVPVFEYNFEENESSKNKITGILNIDSNSEKFSANPELIDQTKIKIGELAELFSLYV